MILKKTNSVEINGTSLQGHLEADYDELIACFGTPNSTGDAYKIQVEWVLHSPDGQPVTIYDWKYGEAYCQDGTGVTPDQIRHWNIGGKSYQAVIDVLSDMDAFRIRQRKLKISSAAALTLPGVADGKLTWAQRLLKIQSFFKAKTGRKMGTSESAVAAMSALNHEAALSLNRLTGLIAQSGDEALVREANKIVDQYNGEVDEACNFLHMI